MIYIFEGISYNLTYNNNNLSVNNYISKINTSSLFLDRNYINNYSFANWRFVLETDNSNFKFIKIIMLCVMCTASICISNMIMSYQFLNYDYTLNDIETDTVRIK